MNNTAFVISVDQYGSKSFNSYSSLYEAQLAAKDIYIDHIWHEIVFQLEEGDEEEKGGVNFVGVDVNFFSKWRGETFTAQSENLMKQDLRN